MYEEFSVKKELLDNYDIDIDSMVEFKKILDEFSCLDSIDLIGTMKNEKEFLRYIVRKTNSFLDNGKGFKVMDKINLSEFKKEMQSLEDERVHDSPPIITLVRGIWYIYIISTGAIIKIVEY